LNGCNPQAAIMAASDIIFMLIGFKSGF